MIRIEKCEKCKGTGAVSVRYVKRWVEFKVKTVTEEKQMAIAVGNSQNFLI